MHGKPPDPLLGQDPINDAGTLRGRIPPSAPHPHTAVLACAVYLDGGDRLLAWCPG
jgi:hypothetical protein